MATGNVGGGIREFAGRHNRRPAGTREDRYMGRDKVVQRQVRGTSYGQHEMRGLGQGRCRGRMVCLALTKYALGVRRIREGSG